MRLFRIILLGIFTLGLGVAVVYVALSGTPPTNQNGNVSANLSIPPPGSYQAYAIEDLVVNANQRALETGRFNTTGIVIDIPSCPPCPRDAVCMPCPPPSLLVAGRDDAPESERLAIEAETDATVFRVGQQYLFSITIDGETQTVTLLGARAL